MYVLRHIHLEKKLRLQKSVGLMNFLSIYKHKYIHFLIYYNFVIDFFRFRGVMIVHRYFRYDSSGFLRHHPIRRIRHLRSRSKN